MTTGCFTSRRSFLKTTVAVSTAAAASWGHPSAWGVELPSATTGMSTSHVSLAAGDDRANIAFKALEPFKKEIAAAIGKKHVIIKPNNVIPNRPLSASHADNLEGILEFLRSIGKKDIAIAESPAMGSALDGFESLGYNKFVAQYGVRLVDLDKDDFLVVQCIDQKDFQPHPCRMARRQLQHSLNGGATGYVDQFVAGQTALLDQIDHGHEKLPAPGQKPGQLLLVHFSLLAYGVVAFLHGGSPFKVWQPDSFRIRLNRRSTFNYGWDILERLSVHRNDTASVRNVIPKLEAALRSWRDSIRSHGGAQ